MRWMKFDQAGRVGIGYGRDDQVVVVEGDDVFPLLIGESDPIETGEVLDLADLELLAPLSPVRNVMCVGWNYLAHFEERSRVHGERPLPDVPAFFTKTTTAVAGPFEDLPSHSELTPELDWEVELGVVIGREATNLSEAGALDVIAGYVVAQDISARDLQKAHGVQWFKGKSLDKTCPIGPSVVSADEISDPQALDISCSVNGEIKQSANTSLMIFPIARILAELSAGLTLVPGDLILTGTPEGVGFSRVPPEFLHPGDILESTVSSIGTIRNRIV